MATHFNSEHDMTAAAEALAEVGRAIRAAEAQHGMDLFGDAA